MTSFARRERLALCDTALLVGPDAPTLCDPWDVKALLCHLLVRERKPPLVLDGDDVDAFRAEWPAILDDAARTGARP